MMKTISITENSGCVLFCFIEINDKTTSSHFIRTLFEDNVIFLDVKSL